MAIAVPALRSSSSGKAMTLLASTRAAKQKPTAMPMPIIAQPAWVVSASWAKADSDRGSSGPRVSR